MIFQVLGSLIGAMGTLGSASIGAGAQKHAANLQYKANRERISADRADNAQKFTQDANRQTLETFALNSANQQRVLENMVEGYRQTLLRNMGGSGR